MASQGKFSVESHYDHVVVASQLHSTDSKPPSQDVAVELNVIGS